MLPITVLSPMIILLDKIEFLMITLFLIIQFLPILTPRPMKQLNPIFVGMNFRKFRDIAALINIIISIKKFIILMIV